MSEEKIMSTILESIATSIGARPPLKETEIPIASFVRKANRLATADVYRTFTAEAKEYLATATKALKVPDGVVPAPEDFIEGVGNEETDSEAEEEQYLAKRGIPGTTTNTTYNVQTILQKFASGSIKIPDLQRDQVWRRDSRQGFLDSLLHSLITPHLVFAQDPSEDAKRLKDHNTFYILDGLQRISTLIMFITDGKESLGPNSEFPNKKFVELPPEIQSEFMQKQITINEIKCEKQYWNGIFRLINKGGMPLNAMEIRRSQYPHPILYALESITKEHQFWTALYGKDNRRKAGLEALLRAVAMHYGLSGEYGYHRYNKPMELFLNRWCDSMDRYELDPDELAAKIDRIIRATFFHVAGKKAFKLHTTKASQTNKSLLDVMFHGALCILEKEPDIDEEALGKRIFAIKEHALSNPSILLAMTKDTSGAAAVMARMKGIEVFVNGDD